MEIAEAIQIVNEYNEKNDCGGFLEAMMEMQEAYFDLEQPYRLAYRVVFAQAKELFAPMPY